MRDIDEMECCKMGTSVGYGKKYPATFSPDRSTVLSTVLLLAMLRRLPPFCLLCMRLAHNRESLADLELQCAINVTTFRELDRRIFVVTG